MGHISRVVASIGHTLSLEPRGAQDYIAVCTCGYVSVKRRNVAIALEAAEHHMRVVFREHAASGRPFPLEDTPDEQEFESRLTVVA